MSNLKGTPTQYIRPKELQERLRAGERFQIIDVRDPQEYEEGHVPCALNMPLEQAESRLRDIHPHDPAVLVCNSGSRAEICLQLLEKHKNNLVVLEGGTSCWEREGYPVVTTAANRLPLMRQVQIGAGSLVLMGSLLGYFADRSWIFLSMFVGTGLLIAGLTGFCGMAKLLGLMRWNKPRQHPIDSTLGICSDGGKLTSHAEQQRT